MRQMAKVLFWVVFLFFLLIILSIAAITAPVEIIVFNGSTSIDNASVWVDGQYKGMTSMGGHLYIPDLDLGFHTVNAQYEDYSGKYVGRSGFENKPGKMYAKVYLQRLR
ncbi:MAG: hypothetical protein MUO26_15070 [Methanotrichaceae archaeon]|nr:hypothetical protein [Methanotrichaceae archaeon]